MFCAGHAFLPDGRLLVAGGTLGYEVLPQNKKQAGGVMAVFNEDPDKPVKLAKGTVFVGKTTVDKPGVRGQLRFKTNTEIEIPAAVKDPKTYKVTASQRNVYVDSELPGNQGDQPKADQYTIEGLTGKDAQNIHGYAIKLIQDEKQEYAGIRSSYAYNPWTERYEKLDPMQYARWYPTLTELHDGRIITISGLDEAGAILDGQTEVFDPASMSWKEVPGLKRRFPTYPAILQTAKPGVLFSAGPSTGWGSAEEGRTPGFWNLADNSFKQVPGLRDPDLLETGSAAWLGPVNDQRLVVVGGGGIGNSPKSTSRIDVIDLSKDAPRFTPLANLEDGTRYPNVVTLPNGKMFITNGASDYRGKGLSDIKKAYLLDPKSGKLERVADPNVGRNYHSTAVLLPNGQVLVAGSDPLFADKENTIPGKFETRIEIYSPPYMFNNDGTPLTRPAITTKNDEFARGGSYTFNVEGPLATEFALVRPGAVTHVTDTNQRLIRLETKQHHPGSYQVSIPDNPAIIPPGHYMLFALDARGVPSHASFVHIDGNAAAPAAVAHH